MRAGKETGYTLLEMMVVVAILATAAAIVIPTNSPTPHQTLNLAASQVADALRFAREEARRTGVTHGVSADVVANQVRVFRLDEAPNPNLKVYDVYQPVSKQPYTLDLSESPYHGVDLSTIGGQMVGTCSDPGNVSFDASGVVRCVEPVTTRIIDATFELSSDALTATVAIDSYTGRVTVR